MIKARRYRQNYYFFFSYTCSFWDSGLFCFHNMSVFLTSGMKTYKIDIYKCLFYFSLSLCVCICQLQYKSYKTVFSKWDFFFSRTKPGIFLSLVLSPNFLVYSYLYFEGFIKFVCVIHLIYTFFFLWPLKVFSDLWIKRDILTLSVKTINMPKKKKPFWM